MNTARCAKCNCRLVALEMERYTDLCIGCWIPVERTWDNYTKTIGLLGGESDEDGTIHYNKLYSGYENERLR